MGQKVEQADYAHTRNEAGITSYRRVIWYEEQAEADQAFDDEAEHNGLPIYLPECEVSAVDPETNVAGYYAVLVYRGLKSSAHVRYRWSRRGSFSREPIATHPRRADLEYYYGGYTDPTDGKFKFPPQLPDKNVIGNQDALGLSGSGASLTEGDENPLYGTETFPSLQADYTLVFSARDRRDDLVAEEGRVRSTFPSLGRAPKVPKGRNLLIMPIEEEEHGDGFSYQYTVPFRLSPPGKPYPEKMYEFISR